MKLGYAVPSTQDIKLLVLVASFGKMYQEVSFFMGRRPGEEEEGGIYHVIQRGNSREFIFSQDEDKDYLVWQFKLLGGRDSRINLTTFLFAPEIR